MKQVLVVVDMQRDFVTGSLGTAEARAIVPQVVEKVRRAKEQGIEVVYTLDTHGENYLQTEEGRNLPVPHCLRGTEGWSLIDELADLLADCRGFEKPTFGSVELADYLAQDVEQVELIGVCTGICVISNAMTIKAKNPQAHITVDAACCACVTPQSHQTALDAMKLLQIELV